jgi:thioredoxin 1
MKKMFRSMVLPAALTACLAAGACSKSNNQAADSNVQAVTDGTFQKEVMESDAPVLVDFWATWCGPCRMYGPIVDKVADEYKGRLKVVRVDVDQNPNLSRTYQIRAIPASFVIQKGNVVRSWVGLVSEDDVRQQLDQVLSTASPTSSHS